MMAKIRVRDLQLNLRSSGEGVPFVWGHGLMSSMAVEDALGWFNQEDWRPDKVKLVRYDARGHGQSEVSTNPDAYHWRNLGRDMLAVADYVGAQRFVVGGASMGCATALYAALQAPERVKGLVLMIPPTAWETRAAQERRYSVVAVLGGLLGGVALARMMRRQTDRVVPHWLNQAEPHICDGVLQGLRGLRRRTLWNLFRGAARTDLPPRDVLKAIVHIPATILTWTDDPTHPVSSAEQLHRLLPESTLFVASGHADYKSMPGRVLDFVLKHS